jgi:hypothetical protein
MDLKKKETQNKIYKKQLRILGHKFRQTMLREIWRKTVWVRLIKFCLVMDAIVDKFSDRVKEIARLEEIARGIYKEEEIYNFPQILKIPRSNYTFYMQAFADKMSGKFLNKFFLQVFDQFKLIQKFKLAKIRT